jgi:hypothetical protein
LDVIQQRLRRLVVLSPEAHHRHDIRADSDINQESDYDR